MGLVTLQPLPERAFSDGESCVPEEKISSRTQHVSVADPRFRFLGVCNAITSVLTDRSR